MGQAKRRKELGEYPTVQFKPRKAARIKQDDFGYSDLMSQAFAAIALSGLMTSKHRLPAFIKEESQ